MITWLLGLNFKAIEITVGAGFTTVIMLLLFIAFKVEEIEKDEHK